jgi:hypothetical protein
MKQQNSHLLFPELTEAILNGYDQNFFLNSDGLLQCLLNPDKEYEINEVSITVITCPLLKATIYLIDPIDGGCKGTMVEYWEHFSS